MTNSLRVCALLTLAALSACKGKDAASELQKGSEGRVKLTLQLNWVPEPEFGGFYAAKHLGLYQTHGLDVDIVAGSAGIQTWQMVATGKVPLALSTSDEVVRAKLKDADVLGIYAVYQTSPRAFMVHESSGVSSLEDIFKSGTIKRVAMEAGKAEGRFLEKRYGFGSVELIQYSGNLSLFLQDPTMAQQCFIFSEPVSAKLQGVPVRAFSLAESGFNPYLNIVVTSREFLDKNRAAVESFVHATREGWQAYLDDPGPTNEYMRTQGADMTLEAMKLAADLQKPLVTDGEGTSKYLGHMSEERWRTSTQQLVDLGEIQSVPDIATCFANIPPR